MKKLKNLLDRIPMDNKLLVALVTYALTYAVTKAGLDLDAIVIPPYTLSVIVSLAAAGFVGWWTSNEATTLREGDTYDGNPDPALVAQHGLDDAAP